MGIEDKIVEIEADEFLDEAEKQKQINTLREAGVKVAEAKARNQARDEYNSRANSAWRRLEAVKGADPDPLLDADVKIVYTSLRQGDPLTAEDTVKQLEKESARLQALADYAGGKISEDEARNFGVKF